MSEINHTLEELIGSFDADARIVEGKQFIEITIQPENLISLATFLKDDPMACFDFLVCLSGVDYGDDLGVVYHIRSTRDNRTVVVKTRIPDRKDPVIESVTGIWPGAEYHEREVFDLFGIKFANHPDLRRFFLDSSSGYPLRKDYTDDINIVTK
jgi:NADH:ubiquinone oxidoreductase subunit C